MRRFLLLFTFLFLTAAAQAQQAIPPAQSALGRHGMVVAQEARAAKIGAGILKRGGNAVDAAVAVGFAMAVTYPDAGNLGGGGFMVIHLAKGDRNTTIDYRETAPAAATKTMFLGADGKPDPAKSRSSGLAVGVPGTVAGLAMAERKYGSGRFTLAQLIAPAIRLARDGFPFEGHAADELPRVAKRVGRWPSSRAIFFHDGAPLKAGARLVQPELAATLQAIAQHGPRAFYHGRIAGKIAAAVRDAGGIMTAADLAHYRAIERKPIIGRYRGDTIVAMPPPSSGGVTLIEMLNILQGFDLATLGRGAPAFHDQIEAMKRAYADRAVYLGDPAFVKMPIGRLTSKRYAARLRATITAKATPAADIHPGLAVDNEGHNTTHFSVIDRAGNAVSNTYTLNFGYGLGLIASGTGVLLNNELDDFTAKPGTANAYGLVGYDANLPAPGKRPLSSMTPTIVLRDGKPLLVTGSPGGSRIITTVLQVIENVIDFHMGVAAAVSAPRLHNQWEPDKTFVEPGFDPQVLAALKARGHILVPTGAYTDANSIAVTRHGYVGAADRRTRGSLAVGY